jgi:hypothetical protein
MIEPVAWQIHFNNNAVMDQPVDGRSRHHRVLKDLFPLAEREVAREHDTATFIPFSQEREEHFHLVTVLLDVADIIDNEHLDFRELLQELGQSKRLLGLQEILDQERAPREDHTPPLLDELMSEGGK